MKNQNEIFQRIFGPGPLKKIIGDPKIAFGGPFMPMHSSALPANMDSQEAGDDDLEVSEEMEEIVE